jgi:hypothetical protein
MGLSAINQCTAGKGVISASRADKIRPLIFKHTK